MCFATVHHLSLIGHAQVISFIILDATKPFFVSWAHANKVPVSELCLVVCNGFFLTKTMINCDSSATNIDEQCDDNKNTDDD